MWLDPTRIGSGHTRLLEAVLCSRVGAHSSKLLAYTGNWAKLRYLNENCPIQPLQSHTFFINSFATSRAMVSNYMYVQWNPKVDTTGTTATYSQLRGVHTLEASVIGTQGYFPELCLAVRHVHCKREATVLAITISDYR